MVLNPSIHGTLTRVAAGNVGSPSVSADGTTIVYTRWNGDNWDIDAHRNGKTESVSSDPAQDLDPRVSANGDVVVWSRYSGESYDIYQRKDGKTTPVATSAADETVPDISADGKTIVYTYDDTSKRQGFDIHRCRDGKCEALTTDWPVDNDPKLSGDGERVFFRRKVDFDGGDIWMHQADGSLKQLTFDPHQESDLTVSGDGQMLAWSQQKTRESDSDLFVYDLKSGKSEKIGEPSIDEGDPALSGDGSTLVYTRGGKSKSDLMLREGGKTVTLTNGGFNRSPSLSADGRVLTWTAVDPDDSSQSVIYRFDRD